MVYSWLGILLCLCIQNSIGEEKPSTPQQEQDGWWGSLGFTDKRPLRGDKEGFWAVRGKRSAPIYDNFYESLEQSLDEDNEGHDIELTQEEQLYYDAMTNLAKEIQEVNGVNEVEALELLYYILYNHDEDSMLHDLDNLPEKRGVIKPNGLFGSFKRAIIKPNGMFTSLMKRSLKPNGMFNHLFKRGMLKPNGLFSISGKRMTLKPNGLFNGKRATLKPNSLFNIAGKRSMFKPNSLFNLSPPKRSLKPNGLFAFKRQVFKPNGLFAAFKRGGLKPNGLFNTYKRSGNTVDLDNYETLKDLMIKKDKGFWAVRGKKDDDFWAVRGKKDDDFWAVRGKKSTEMDVEQDDE